eukprot:5801179-Pleurochrysis_carterae.AAC.2
MSAGDGKAKNIAQFSQECMWGWEKGGRGRKEGGSCHTRTRKTAKENTKREGAQKLSSSKRHFTLRRDAYLTHLVSSRYTFDASRYDGCSWFESTEFSCKSLLHGHTYLFKNVTANCEVLRQKRHSHQTRAVWKVCQHVRTRSNTCEVSELRPNSTEHN